MPPLKRIPGITSLTTNHWMRDFQTCFRLWIAGGGVEFRPSFLRGKVMEAWRREKANIDYSLLRIQIQLRIFQKQQTFFCWIESGRIITTSADLNPKGSCLEGKSPYFKKNQDWWNIIIWSDLNLELIKSWRWLNNVPVHQSNHTTSSHIFP